MRLIPSLSSFTCYDRDSVCEGMGVSDVGV